MSLIVYADDDTSITMSKMIPDTTGSFSLFSRLRGYKLFIYKIFQIPIKLNIGHDRHWKATATINLIVSVCGI